MSRTAPWVIAVAVLAAVPLAGLGKYPLHLLIMILLWSFIYTSWSLMGRFGLVSFGHGAFMGTGAYVVTMLWNHFGVTPWIGIPLGVALAVVVAVLIGYPCFRFRITGHYFALVTLALTEVARLVIIALRDQTGGSLGVTPKTALAGGESFSLFALQFADKAVFFYIALVFWLAALWVWRRVDRSMARYAMLAISQEEDAAASVGVNVTRTKLVITVLSAAMTALGGALYGQYQLYVNPDTVSGIGISLQIVFAVIAGGMYVQLGPTVGAVFTLLLAEGLRVAVGHDVHGLDTFIYGFLLVIFIIYMPNGILGKILERWGRRGTAVPAAAPARCRGLEAGRQDRGHVDDRLDRVRHVDGRLAARRKLGSRRVHRPAGQRGDGHEPGAEDADGDGVGPLAGLRPLRVVGVELPRADGLAGAQLDLDREIARGRDRLAHDRAPFAVRVVDRHDSSVRDATPRRRRVLPRTR